MSLYGDLGVENTASLADIKKAYRLVSLENHPDKNNKLSDEAKLAKEEKFVRAQLAYAVLSDPVRKQHYDDYGEEGYDKAMAFLRETFSRIGSGPFVHIFGSSNAVASVLLKPEDVQVDTTDVKERTQELITKLADKLDLYENDTESFKKTIQEEVDNLKKEEPLAHELIKIVKDCYTYKLVYHTSGLSGKLTYIGKLACVAYNLGMSIGHAVSSYNKVAAIQGVEKHKQIDDGYQQELHDDKKDVNHTEVATSPELEDFKETMKDVILNLYTLEINKMLKKVCDVVIAHPELHPTTRDMRREAMQIVIEVYSNCLVKDKSGDQDNATTRRPDVHDTTTSVMEKDNWTVIQEGVNRRGSDVEMVQPGL